MLNKNIYFICGNLYPYHVGGAEIYNYYLANQLSNIYSTHIVSNLPKSNLYKTKHIKIPHLKPLALFSSLYIFFYFLFKRTKKDIVILSYSRSNWLNWWPYPLLKSIKNFKFIIIIHGGGLSTWNFRPFYVFFFKSSKCIFGVSKRICAEYEKRLKVNIHFLTPLIPFNKSKVNREISRTKFSLEKSQKIFLIVGSLKPLKNPNIIINAIISLKNKKELPENYRFIFAGSGPLKQTLENVVIKNNLQQQVRFLGDVDRLNISQLYHIVDYYIISSDFEGTPLSLLEAMFNGLLILAANSPGINNIIIDSYNGYLFDLKNPESLECLINGIEKRDYPLIRENAVNTFQNEFDYNAMLVDLIKFLE